MDQRLVSGVCRPFIALSQISKRFGGTHALKDIDWSIDRGEVHCLVGENGSGKSTLIKILCGVHAPEQGGGITIDGVAHERLTPHQAKLLGLHVIFQDLSLFPNLTVQENIAVGLELSRLPCGVRRERRCGGRPRNARSPRGASSAQHARWQIARRTTPDRRHLSWPRRERARPVHGRADRVAHPA